MAVLPTPKITTLVIFIIQYYQRLTMFTLLTGKWFHEQDTYCFKNSIQDA